MTTKVVEIFTTAKGYSLGRDDLITIKVGLATATLTAGEWSRLVATPTKLVKA